MKPSQYPTSPEHIWEHFYQLTQIPRPSGQEQQVRDHIIALADSKGLQHKVDAAGNLVVYVPASQGYENAPTVAIQNHLDMVTVKTGDKAHDFTTDPLQLEIVDGWLRADRTTLGADNGIGVAAAMAVITDETVVHPPLELLFTIEEETGLVGASELDASMLSATKMLNLDTEDWGEIYLGCAGGYGYDATRPLATEAAKAGTRAYRFHLKGLQGGHSGVQIHEQLGNANKLLVEFLTSQTELPYQIVSFRGGIAHNVIAREASTVVMINDSDLDAWKNAMEDAKQRWLSYLPAADNAIEWILESVDDAKSDVVSAQDTQAFLQLISALPHGAQSYNLNEPADLVDLSCNLAVVNIKEGQLHIQTSLRFFNNQQTLGLKQQIEAILNAFQLESKCILDYPGWNPNFDSPLVNQAKALAEEITGEEVALKAIHAGLECGILLSKKPDMDVVSMGPTIRGAHSPTERMEISTVEPFWLLVKNMLKALK
ncbi:beta-Ala-His dipeptidase [Reinekea marina]|uniref:Beta-Ala-His dipeptidase n=1 Tax=Reinekea marina TaxID=1310421 RepID=A0ABV7WM48_9GAMM|nr:beta-Ala-His dipeptidase [Reinekea marina]MDN3650771.1 beta-Ala-His dipeptidase [Reinekea marina]